MRDNELRGIILEALYNQRRRDLVDFETELGKLPLPDGAMESIVRQLEKKGLIERPFRPRSGVGKGRITAYGIDVVEKTTSPPLSMTLAGSRALGTSIFSPDCFFFSSAFSASS
jgi:hypothetical protein